MILVSELEELRLKLLAEIESIKKELWQPVNPWNPDSGEISPMVRRRQRNEELIKLQDLYDRCFPKMERVLDLLRERYRERVLY